MVVTWASNIWLKIVAPENAIDRLIQLITFNHCDFYNVEKVGENLYAINKVHGSPAHVSSLFKALEELEWDCPEKIYIFFKERKGRGKYGKKAGAKIDSGSEGGDREGTHSDPEHGEGAGVGGDRDSGADPSDGNDEGFPEVPAAVDDCD